MGIFVYRGELSLTILKQVIYMICATIMFTILIPFINVGSFQVVYWLNLVFVISLLFIVLGSIAILLKSGPLVRFGHHLVYFFKKISKRRVIADNVEGKTAINKGENETGGKVPKAIKSIILSGVILGSLSTVLSFLVI